ncbi:MAG: PEP-CTERM sorting domain-containing protein [Akkermansiaceae bacterium]
MKNIRSTCVLLILGSVLNVSAATTVFNIARIRLDAAGTLNDAGDSSLSYTNILDDTGNDSIVDYTVTGDFDGGRGGLDTLTFTITISGELDGSALDIPNQGSPYAIGDSILNFSIHDIELSTTSGYTLDLVNSSIEMDLIQTYRLISITTTEVQGEGALHADNGVDPALTFTAGEVGFKVLNLNLDTPSGITLSGETVVSRWRYGFNIVSVPEPSSSTLFVLASLTLILKRRRA